MASSRTSTSRSSRRSRPRIKVRETTTGTHPSKTRPGHTTLPASRPACCLLPAPALRCHAAALLASLVPPETREVPHRFFTCRSRFRTSHSHLRTSSLAASAGSRPLASPCGDACRGGASPLAWTLSRLGQEEQGSCPSPRWRGPPRPRASCGVFVPAPFRARRVSQRPGGFPPDARLAAARVRHG